ncbi:MAG: hypothetical protein DME36_05915 [Verrucomicrobia bacterium]|nr:MAG: hypothetical protein DME36_05915 [Verrucomicrobiota bacterium]
MAGAESIRQVARARAPFSAWLGIVLLFVLFGVIVLAVIGPTPRAGTYEQKRAKAREEKLKMAREEDAKALGSYAWIDKNKGVARIPIARAMELTVADLTKKEPEPAGPIAAPAAPASAAPTGAPAPSAAPSASPAPTGTPKPTSVAGPNSESRGQPAAAVNPPPAPPGTQPGGAKPPAASPAPPAAKPNPAGSPSATPAQPTPGTPTPAPIKTP